MFDYDLVIISSKSVDRFTLSFEKDYDLPKDVCFGNLLSVDYVIGRATPRFAINKNDDGEITSIVLPCLSAVNSFDVCSDGSSLLQSIASAIIVACENFNSDHVIPMYYFTKSQIQK